MCALLLIARTPQPQQASDRACFYVRDVGRPVRASSFAAAPTCRASRSASRGGFASFAVLDPDAQSPDVRADIRMSVTEAARHLSGGS